MVSYKLKLQTSKNYHLKANNTKIQYIDLDSKIQWYFHEKILFLSIIVFVLFV